MDAQAATCRAQERMASNRFSGPDAAPYPVRGHHLLCAVCTRGGCQSPPPGREVIDALLEVMWAYPFTPLQIIGDLDITRAHYLDVYAGRGEKPLPSDFGQRHADYVWRRKDLEVIRVLGIVPNSVMPAYHVYKILFQRQLTLDGICRTGSQPSEAWPECPHARAGYYEKIAGDGSVDDLREQYLKGEELDGHGLWAMIRARTREDMTAAKDASARFLLEQADHLYMRPNHVLCLLCTAEAESIPQDNLVELRQRMVANPEIPVTLCEGICMVCDPCNVYHPDENLCYHAHMKNTLRDLMILERLGLPPGATLTARELFARIYERISSLKDICGWRDGSDTAPFWSPCAYQVPALDNARNAGLIAGKNA